MLKSYTHTKTACWLGYVTQAIVNNFAPLLFLIFREEFGVSLTQLTVLVTVNFAVQLTVDCIFSKLADKIGYRVCLVAAHVCAAAGLVGLALFPKILPSAFAGLIVAVVLYAMGSGLVEVLVSPTVEACPSANKSAQMSLLHSFYCWGTAGVVLLTTLFFLVAGKSLWWVLALVWAVLPLFNAVYVSFVPIPKIVNEDERLPLRKLLSTKRFWLFFGMMALAGAAELAMSQWSSAFAESGLRISKTAGDLAGPCLFALLMGVARLLYSRFGKKLRVCMIFSGILCVGCYLLAWLAPMPALALVGCALCGFSVGILWPGVFSLAAEEIPRGGTAMFALLAMAGDMGCTAGPTLVGLYSGAMGDNLGAGLALAIVFPALFVVLILCTIIKRKPKE